MSRSAVVIFLLVASVVAIYWQTTGFQFVDFDDPQYVRNNPVVRQGLTVEGVQWAFTTNHVVNWHPLTWLSLMLDAELSRMVVGDPGRPAIYHLTNVGLHALNVLLLLALLRTMTGMFWPSAFAAGLLAVHPIHVESVAWVSERKDLLSLMFFLLTIRAYVSYTHHRWATATGKRRYALAALLLALGLMSKPMLVTLPFVLLLLDYWPLRRWEAAIAPTSTRQGRRRSGSIAASAGPPRKIMLIVEKLPLLAIAAASSLVTYLVQQGTGTLQYGQWLSLEARLANAVVSYVRYVGKLFWPIDLSPLYPNHGLIGEPLAGWTGAQVAGAALLLMGISACVVMLARKRRYLFVGWLWFLGTLVPVIGLVQIGPQAMADRYAYIPFIGLYLIAGWGMFDLTSWLTQTRLPRRMVECAAVCAGAFIIVALAVIAHQQTRYWRDSITLFRRAIAVTDRNWLMHNNLAGVLARERRYEEALAHMRQALAIYDEVGWLHAHHGELLSAAGDKYEAQLAFETAVRKDPADAKSIANLGVVLMQRGRVEEGLAHLRHAVDLTPSAAALRKQLAIALASHDLLEEAIVHLERAMELQPSDLQTQELLATIRAQR